MRSKGALIDADRQTSGISGINTTSMNAGVNQQSGTNSGQSSKIQKQSNTKEKESSSKISDHSSTSLSQTQTGVISQGALTAAVNKIEYVEVELGPSMMDSIRIIERLLTQAKYHKEHVLYKNYPDVKIETEVKEITEKKRGFNIDMQNKEEEKKEKEEDKFDPNSKEVDLKPLFQFRCDAIVGGRNISCMDFNVSNPDLLAVSYGEFDMDNITEKKKGILAFWTFKNPNFPEKIIHTDNCITCCQFSKRNPNIIATGDSLGNIAIYDVKRKDSNLPLCDSREIEGKHTDIVWEIQWVDKAEKGETLVSISGDG